MQRLLTRKFPALRILLVCAALCLSTAARAVDAAPQNMSAPEVARLVEAGDLVLLDIRSPQEWEESGVARGALPISMHEPDFPKRLQEVLSRIPPERIGLICATGGRSNYVAEVLEKNGIGGVVDVSEGMFGNGTNPGWIARGLPVVPARDALDNYTLWRLSEVKEN
ncbi:MAG: rhodanese-like domain-containing protein [Ruegeria sp.]